MYGQEREKKRKTKERENDAESLSQCGDQQTTRQRARLHLRTSLVWLTTLGK